MRSSRRATAWRLAEPAPKWSSTSRNEAAYTPGGRPPLSVKGGRDTAQYHPMLQEPPYLNQQLPGQRHNAHLSGSRPTASEALLVPAAQPPPGLVPQPAPRHRDRADVPAARLADPLLPVPLTERDQNWRRTHQRSTSRSQAVGRRKRV